MDKSKGEKPCLNYVDIEFVVTGSKNGKTMVIKNEEPNSDYAEVVLATSANSAKENKIQSERLYRATSNFSPKTQHSGEINVRVGDIVLGQQENNDHVFGTVFSTSSKEPPKQGWLPTSVLQLYIPVETPSASQDAFKAKLGDPAAEGNKQVVPTIPKPVKLPTKPKDGVKEELAMKYSENFTKPVGEKVAPPSVNHTTEVVDEPDAADSDLLSTLASIGKNSKSVSLKSTLPDGLAPTLAKIKFDKKDKIPKIPESVADASEIYVFAISDRKSKETGVLSFKKYQLAVMVYTHPNRWWCIRTEKDIHGWVPADFWRILPENREDNLTSTDYVPWNFGSMPRSECEELLMSHGKDRDFVMRESATPGQMTLSMKHNNGISNFHIETKPDNTYFIGKHDFKTIYNVILYYKKHPLAILDDGSQACLGKPFANLAK